MHVMSVEEYTAHHERKLALAEGKVALAAEWLDSARQECIKAWGKEREARLECERLQEKVRALDAELARSRALPAPKPKGLPWYPLCSAFVAGMLVSILVVMLARWI